MGTVVMYHFVNRRIIGGSRSIKKESVRKIDNEFLRHIDRVRVRVWLRGDWDRSIGCVKDRLIGCVSTC